MDVLAGVQPPPQRNFDQLAEVRAEKREQLRGRNNVTSCRSPTRELDTRLIKSELKEKRHLEYLRRRSVSPEVREWTSARTRTSPRTLPMKHHSSNDKYQTSRSMQTELNANGHKRTISTSNRSLNDGPVTNAWAALWLEQVTLINHERGHSKNQATTSTVEINKSSQHRTKRENSLNGVHAQRTSTATIIQTESVRQHLSHQTKRGLPKKTLRETGVQTRSGLVTVKESDIQRLAECLQEALWREEAVKKKLAALQESTTHLVNSSNKIWTARCSEDLLRNKIKALEAQLQVCLQKFPKDGVKKRAVQMEKQKLIYEEKALVALQNATQEKTEALSKAETLQESLVTAKAEALKWQSLYEELKRSSGQLRENQQLSDEQLQQLHGQVELFQAREAELKEEVVSSWRENEELRGNICRLDEDNQVLREEIESLKGGGNESQDDALPVCWTPEEAEPQVMQGRDSRTEEQLRHTQEKLQLKEKECEDMQTELHALEVECQSNQARLLQCRHELRKIGQRHRKVSLCGPCWIACALLLLLLTVVGVVTLWLWHPPFREQIEELYSDVETRILNYLSEMASPQNSACVRPI